MILSPYFWIAVLIFALVNFGAGYHNGYQHASDHAEAGKLQAVAKAQARAEKQAKADRKTETRYETARETVRTVYVKVKEKAHENIARHSDYAGCSLDADGLRLYNHNPNTPENPTPGTDSDLSGPAASIGWQAGNAAGEQPGARADVLRLPSAPQGIVAMGSGVGGTGSGAGLKAEP